MFDSLWYRLLWVLVHLKGDRIVKLEPTDFNDEKDRRIWLWGLTSIGIMEDYILEKNSKKKNN